MQDNSSNRRKTLIVSVLAFLFAGGGIFLFFIVQGSNDLTRAGKNQNFSYGTAAREGVTSFFKSMGVIPEEEPKLSEAAVARNASRGLPLDELGIASTNPDMSDWMDKGPAASASGGASRPSASPTSVPKMQGGGGSGLAGGGGGGTKSAGSSTRFGEGSAAGSTSISNKTQAGAGGGEGKGTLATLKNTRALLGEGLRSGSAMTANAKWNQSFGLGSGSNRGGDMSYKGGMVNLDTIKSGDIASLKMDKKGGLKTPDVTSPVKNEEGTQKALAGDAKVQQAMKDKAEADMKKDLAKGAIDAAGGALGKGGTGTGAGVGTGAGAGTGTGTGTGDAMSQLPEDVRNSINGVTCGQGCTTESGDKYKDSNRAITVNQGPPPTYECKFEGEQTNADGTVIRYSDTVTYDEKGNVMNLLVSEKPK